MWLHYTFYDLTLFLTASTFTMALLEIMTNEVPDSEDILRQATNHH